mgnify:FL=1
MHTNARIPTIDGVETPYDVMCCREAYILMDHSLRMLDERLRRVIHMRVGIGSRAMTQEEIGKKIGVSRKRVAQLQDRALKQLREWITTIYNVDYI